MSAKKKRTETGAVRGDTSKKPGKIEDIGGAIGDVYRDEFKLLNGADDDDWDDANYTCGDFQFENAGTYKAWKGIWRVFFWSQQGFR